MRLSFNDGSLLLEDTPHTVPYAEWYNQFNTVAVISKRTILYE